MLAALSPLTAEFLLGDQYLQGLAPAPMQLAMFVSFVAFYGMAAVLVRELGRRLRLGWPGLLLLALGYGIVEEGLITQTLFNPHYLGLDLLAPGHVAALGMGAPWTVFVISLHVVWSIATPIAIIEAWAGRGGRAATQSWLGPVALVVCSVILVIGAAAIFAISTVFASPPFLAQPAQLIGAAVAAGLAVIGAMAFRGRDTGQSATVLTSGTLVISGLFGALATTAFQIANRVFPDTLGWLSFAGMLAVWVVAVLIMKRWRPAPLGVAAGAVLTYAWVGMLPAIRTGTVGAVVEQSLLIVIFALLLGWTVRRLLDQSSRAAKPSRKIPSPT